MNMRTGVASAATVLVGLVLTACGSEGSGEGGAADGDQGGEMSPQEAELAWTECLRGEGIEVPDLDDDNVAFELGDLTEEELDAAFDKCDDEVPFPGDNLSDEEVFQIQLRHAECMREEGIEDYPDPVPGGIPEAFPIPDNQEEEEALIAAEDKCSERAVEGVEGLDPEADAA